MFQQNGEKGPDLCPGRGQNDGRAESTVATGEGVGKQ